MKKALYKQIASALQAYNNCVKSNNTEWQDKHEDRIRFLTYQYMPSGSGIDNGINFDLESSAPNKLIFTFDYHHMGEGYYKKWTSHKLIVTPSLVSDFSMKITGENFNDVKDYLCDIFLEALDFEVE
jgi:hypothetical protein